MAFLLGLSAGIAAAILEGYVLSVLWRWFIVPVFAAPALSIPYAIGLALIVGMLTHKTRKPEDNPEPFYFLFMGFVLPLAWLATGWIVKLFV